jgi:hypothetical protein
VPGVAGALGILAALVAVFALAGCGARAPRPAELRLERTDLVLIGRTLQRLEGQVHAEVGAARTVWPTLARGLPTATTAATRRAIAAADTHAGALVLPSFVTVEAGLTGPAAGIGGLLKHYALLTQRGWRFIVAAVGAGGAGGTSGASFLRANAGLYIYCVYDGHYDLSLIGKAIVAAYGKLGGPAAFGAELTAARVAALARAYSIPAVRLVPHPAPAVQA